MRDARVATLGDFPLTPVSLVAKTSSATVAAARVATAPKVGLPSRTTQGDCKSLADTQVHKCQ